MKANGDFEIFLATAPGLEPVLCEEAKDNGFRAPKAVPGGVRIEGRWHDVWRANLVMRGASRVLARLDAFRVTELDELEKRARRLPWGEILRADVPVRVEATCARSRIYHSGAAAERIEAGRAVVDEPGELHDLARALRGHQHQFEAVRNLEDAVFYGHTRHDGSGLQVRETS